MRIGATDFHPESHILDDSVELVRTPGQRGLDLVDISMGINIEAAAVPFANRGFMIPTATRSGPKPGC